MHIFVFIVLCLENIISKITTTFSNHKHNNKQLILFYIKKPFVKVGGFKYNFRF
jgi:hypothetical protein